MSCGAGVHSRITTDGGLFAERRDDRTFDGRRGLFLDRDGVVVEFSPYLYECERVRVIESTARAIAAANFAQVPVVLITNQSGIGRGYYTWDDFGRTQTAISSQLLEWGAHLDATFACAYHNQALGKYRFDNHPWRKPNPGMLLEAQRALRIDLTSSLVVGDAISDLTAGRRAGLRRGLLVTRESLREHSQVEIAQIASDDFSADQCTDVFASILHWLKYPAKDPA